MPINFYGASIIFPGVSGVMATVVADVKSNQCEPKSLTSHCSETTVAASGIQQGGRPPAAQIFCLRAAANQKEAVWWPVKRVWCETKHTGAASLFIPAFYFKRNRNKREINYTHINLLYPYHTFRLRYFPDDI